MSPQAFGLTALALSWLAYFVLHSVLASPAVKHRAARTFLGRGGRYRLWYTVLATVLAVPPLALLFMLRGEPLWQWRGAAWWITNALALLALVGFAATLRYYDMQAFLGLRRAAPRTATGDAAALTLSPFHRFVRHPWYTLGLVILWTRSMDPALLVTAVCLTGYVVVGSRLEERKLVADYGEVYRRYRAQVPALVPRPWRRLRPEQARALERQARKGAGTQR